MDCWWWYLAWASRCSSHRAIRCRYLGLGEIPSPWLADKAFAHSVKEVHEISANILVILAVFHMTAALVHHIVFGDNTLRRMLPRMRKR
jgi:cytochrome b561